MDDDSFKPRNTTSDELKKAALGKIAACKATSKEAK